MTARCPSDYSCPTSENQPTPLCSSHGLSLLETLPSEVSRQLANHVTEGKFSSNAFNFAVTSSEHLNAALSTLPNQINFENNRFIPNEWKAVLGASIRSASFFYLDPNRLANILRSNKPISAKQFLSWQGLESIQVESWDRTGLYNLSTIQELTLYVTGFDKWKPYFELFRLLSLKSLRLKCTDNVVLRNDCGYCSFAELCLQASDLGDACPLLECFELDAKKPECWSTRDSVNIFSKVLPAVPYLQEVTVRWRIPKEAYGVLRKVKRVRLNFSGAVEVAIELGNCVVEVSDEVDRSYVTEYGKDDVEKLRICSRLEHLAICVREEASEELVELVRHLRDLKCLSLKWIGLGKHGTGEDKWEDGSHCERGLLESIVRNVPGLTELKIHRARVGIEEWETVIREKGSQLQCLEVEVSRQDELAMERLERILLLLSEHARVLTRFVPVDRTGGLEVSKGIVRRLFRALERVKRSAPIVDWDSMLGVLHGHEEIDVRRALAEWAGC